MDLLFQRYASPYLFIDGMLESGQFSCFVSDFVKAKNDTEEWEVFLHKVWDKSYKEFKESLKISREIQQMTETEIETTVMHTMNILNNFTPE
jgi:hypothetical protein